MEEINWIVKQSEILTRLTHVNGWVPVVYMSYIESKLQFISRIEFIRSKFSNVSAHVSVVDDRSYLGPRVRRGRNLENGVRCSEVSRPDTLCHCHVNPTTQIRGDGGDRSLTGKLDCLSNGSHTRGEIETGTDVAAAKGLYYISSAL